MKVSAAEKAVAIVGVGAIMPDAPNAPKFWQNIKDGRNSITEVTPDRWDSSFYYDPDLKALDKSYTKIGGWVREWDWDPLKWRLPIPPKVSAAMDLTQKWGVVTAREALNDYGYPEKPLNPERVAVILGNAMGGDTHLYSAARVFFPEFVHKLLRSDGYASLPDEKRREIMEQIQEGFYDRVPPVSEDTMPGELSNILAGRIAALFDFKGPNYTADAACASAMAAMSAAIVGLTEHDYDAVLTGGIDANMSPSTFVKFCKLGALSATGSRPYAEGSDGFVMGEGGAIFLMKRLEDAERDGDKIYAVIRGMGGSSDGKGKGITAPNPAGQALCVQRAWEKAGIIPEAGDLIEGHGTSTPVGDAGELESLMIFFQNYNLPVGSIALGSVKSNIGHLKGAAGAAGILKAAFALHEKVLPPSLNFKKPNPIIDFQKVPFKVNTELRPWDVPEGKTRRAAVSAFGFGGTNFHMVMEEYVPGKIASESKSSVAFGQANSGPHTGASLKTPLRGAAVLGADSESELLERLKKLHKEAENGKAPEPAPPLESDLKAGFRLAIDYGDAAELADKAARALKAYEDNEPGRWKALRAKGIYRGEGPAPKVAFLFTGQGSQYVNMLKTLKETEPIVTRVFEEADRTMTPLLGKPLTDCIYLDKSDEASLKEAEENLKQTAITQPAVLATENAIARMLGAYGITPDMVMGHSLGEYGALVAAGAISFDEALKAVSARGKEMTRCALEDNGMMAAAFGPIEKIQEVLNTVDEYVVIANINSSKEAVIGGTTTGVKMAMDAISEAGYTARALQVSHAFHTRIVAPAGESLAQILSKMDLRPPEIPIITNVKGEFYPMGPGVVPEMIKLLGKQVSSPVQFIKGLNTLYDAGARAFVEIGPKRILYGFVEDVLGGKEGVISLFTNHPRIGEAASLNLALCGLYAAGLGIGATEKEIPAAQATVSQPVVQTPGLPTEAEGRGATIQPAKPAVSAFQSGSAAKVAGRSLAGTSADTYTELGKLFAEFMDRGFQIYSGDRASTTAAVAPVGVCVTGASLGLPGTEKVFDDSNIERMLRGDGFIRPIPMNLRHEMANKNITRIVKTAGGEGRFETINSMDDVIKLAARAGYLDIQSDFGFPEERLAALDRVTKLAIGAGIDALRDAGIPLVMRYKTTTKGTKLPDRWMLPDEIRDDTGILFTSAFPGCDSFAEIISGYYEDLVRRERLRELESLYDLVLKKGSDKGLEDDLKQRIDALRKEVEENAYQFDRRFLFRVLSMGHSQFAEYIGARGPNTSSNGACSSGTQAMGLAQDWIRTGRCNRVIIISADDITSDNLMGWFGSGFLASGSAATDEVVEDAATPFDRRRHGLIIGMGASAVVLESRESARARGIRPICNVLGSVVANSAFHGTRLDVSHICHMMEKLISEAEAQWGIDRYQIAPETVFVSHETYTPARGGSASAEVFALRHVFKEAADRILVANTKGATGHPMAVGIEDVISVKILETGIVPPVANFKEVDPELGMLNLSKGGSHPVRYALRLGAGFGSQISMSLMRWEPNPDGNRRPPSALGYQYRIEDPAVWSGWLKRLTGYESPDLEIVKRTLRIKDQGPTTRIENGTSTFSALQSDVQQPQAAAPAVTAPVSGTPITPAFDASPAAAGDATTTAGSGTADGVQKEVMKIIAEKTGYPPDMLDLDLDLEADLGIDTVKQAEMFAAIRAAYDIPREDNLKLRDFPTLAHVVQFVYARKPDLVPAAPVVTAPVSGTPTTPAFDEAATAAGSGTVDEVQEEVLKIIAEKTGYPPDMLDLDLDLEADLGIDTVKQAEMFAAIRAAYDIPREDNLKLRDFPTLAHVIQFVYDRKPGLAPAVTAPVVTASVYGTTATPAVGASPAAAGDADTTAASAAPAADEVQDSDPVKETVLEIIAEKTGYPPDMLDIDLDLEADLGIDTVKQAEMFAAIRTAYDIPREENLKMRDFPTLAHVVQFVYDRKPDLKAGKSASGAEQVSVSEQAVEESVKPVVGSLDAANSIPRRIPVPQLRPDLKLCKPTGVEIQQGIRVVVMPDQGGVGKALISKLEKLGVQPLVMDGSADADSLAKQIEDWKTEGAIRGVYWLPALDIQGNIAELSYDQWKESTRIRVKLLYTTMRSLYDQVEGRGTFLVTATRLGGQHGYGESGAVDPLGGMVTGFTKAFKRERSDATVKVVDFEPSRKTSTLAEILLDETCFDPGVVEVGYKDDHRWTIGLKEQPAGEENTGMKLGKETVFLVTGAAGSIVSAITADLAAASGGVFYLLDLTPEPDPSNTDLQKLVSDKEGLKRDLFERLKSGGKRVTPVMVDKGIAALERSRAALDAIQAVTGAGGVVHYHSLDLTDTGAVAAVIKDIAEQYGRIDVLLHAAGLEISHGLPDKKPAEFDLVFDVKSDGWFNLISNIGTMPLDTAVVFSSVAGRFGNMGQTDYSAANDLLCKCVSNLRNNGSQTKGIAIDWTAWSGIGMAARGSIPTIMKQAGIEMLPPEAGIPVIRRELTTGMSGEVIIGRSLGILVEEFEPQGGLDTAQEGPLAELLKQSGIMTGKVTGMGLYGGLQVETTLDPTEQPFLFDHQINGTPVLPGVMGVEAMAEAARLLFPDHFVGSVENVEFLSPFKFYRNQPRTVIVRTDFRMDDEDIVADCSLIGLRTLHGQTEPEITTHFTGSIRLVSEKPESAKESPVTEMHGGLKVEASHIYSLYFHGPAYQVLDSAWRSGDEVVGMFAKSLPANHEPAELPALVSPRSIELCFQTVSLSILALQERLGLPYAFRELKIASFPEKGAGETFFSVTSSNADGTYNARMLDDKGNVYLTLLGYRIMELPDTVLPNLLAPLKEAFKA
jgi:acyl transferase domain-containing protein/acyl carrier protein/NAD(P)-dependent dehydrogenase (short-subunit alcohol dehydrogenase family)